MQPFPAELSILEICSTTSLTVWSKLTGLELGASLGVLHD